MKNIFIMLLFIGFASISKAQPVNNAIFNGGNNDGFNNSNFAQQASNIFTGGTGDGFNMNAYAQANGNIFVGSNGDGWGRDSFLQPVVNIFNGGSGDGWASAVFIQVGNDIFKGGNGDGWNFSVFESADNAIFKGGVGDGWSSTYRPMGQLPVTLEYFTAARLNESAALLTWKTSQEENVSHYEVERSGDALFFSNIGKIEAGGNSNGSVYHFTDNAVLSGYNYYRLKQVDKDGKSTYSPSRMLNFGNVSSGLVKYYPNPTRGILNIEVPSEIRQQPKVINISNMAGMIIDQIKIPANGSDLIPINLSRYAKGTYLIQLRSQTINSTQRVVLQ